MKREGGNLTAEEYNTLEFDVRDGVAHLTLNRPEAGNAINLELAQELLRVRGACSVSVAT
jgi:enoyl-CoA hydratase/carnithine racemase